MSFICDGFTTHNSTPQAISNSAPTPFSEMPTSNVWWRIVLRCMLNGLLRRSELQHRQMLGKMLPPIERQRLQLNHSPHQRNIRSVVEKFVDVAHRNAVFVFLDSLDLIA